MSNPLQTKRLGGGNSTESTSTSWGQLLTASAEIFDRYSFFFFPDSEERAQATLALMRLTSGVREYAIASGEDLLPLWNELRGNNQLLDLVLAVTGDLYIETDWTVEKAALTLANAIHVVAIRTAASIADQAFYESLGTGKALADVLVGNPWVLTLFLLRRSGRMNLVRPIEPRPEPVKEPVA